MDQDRLNHSYAVGKKMTEIGLKFNLNEEQIQELFVLELNNDIGYEFNGNVINHGKIGGVILKKEAINIENKYIIMAR